MAEKKKSRLEHKKSVRKAQKGKLGLKWHKTLIYLAIFVWLLSAVFAGIFYTGGLFSAFLGTPRWLDIVIGVLNFVFALFLLLVRSTLHGFQEDAPLLLFIAVAVSALIGAAGPVWFGIQYLAEKIFTCVLPVWLPLAVRYGFSVLFFVLNFVYYRKRKFMFKN